MLTCLALAQCHRSLEYLAYRVNSSTRCWLEWSRWRRTPARDTRETCSVLREEAEATGLASQDNCSGLCACSGTDHPCSSPLHISHAILGTAVASESFIPLSGIWQRPFSAVHLIGVTYQGIKTSHQKVPQ